MTPGKAEVGLLALEKGVAGEWGGTGGGQRPLTVLVAMSLLPAPASVPCGGQTSLGSEVGLRCGVAGPFPRPPECGAAPGS